MTATKTPSEYLKQQYPSISYGRKCFFYLYKREFRSVKLVLDGLKSLYKQGTKTITITEFVDILRTWYKKRVNIEYQKNKPVYDKKAQEKEQAYKQKLREYEQDKTKIKPRPPRKRDDISKQSIVNAVYKLIPVFVKIKSRKVEGDVSKIARVISLTQEGKRYCGFIDTTSYDNLEEHDEEENQIIKETNQEDEDNENKYK